MRVSMNACSTDTMERAGSAMCHRGRECLCVKYNPDNRNAEPKQMYEVSICILKITKVHTRWKQRADDEAGAFDCVNDRSGFTPMKTLMRRSGSINGGET